MDDFGNTYQTQKWANTAEEYAHSTSTFGMLDDIALDICMVYGIPYWKQDV